MEKATKLSFLNIDLEECGKVYLIIKNNADRHFRCAEILSEFKEYPNSIAHIILGIEEYIKSLALFLESKRFNLRAIEGYKKLFSNHKTRHSLIKEIYSVILFLSGVLNIKRKNKNDSSIIYGLKILTKIIEGTISATNNYEWWEKADSLKQNCFYVDYYGQVITPENITLREYEETRKYANSLRDDIRAIIAGLSRASLKELEEIRKNLMDADLKELLSESIKRSNVKK